MPEHVSDAEQLIRTGELTLLEPLTTASNVTVLAKIAAPGRSVRCVYKPVTGERPLWDFPSGTLASREVAAYQLSRVMGWSVVPPTVLREGPLGTGSVQLFIEASQDPPVGVFPHEQVPASWLVVAQIHDQAGNPWVLAHANSVALQRLAIFDAISNNADRQTGHVLVDNHGPWGIDQGLSFHLEPKLRTVLWGWVGQPVPAELLTPLRHLAQHTQLRRLTDVLADLIAPDEVVATEQRLQQLAETGTFPVPSPSWPALPWPW